MSLFSKTSKSVKIFLYLWIGITLFLTILAISSVIAEKSWQNKIAQIKRQEITCNPQVAKQLIQARQQGMPEKAIQNQLNQMIMPQAIAAVNVIQSATKWSCVMAIAALIIMIILLGNHSKQNHHTLIYILIALMSIQLIYVAKKYILVNQNFDQLVNNVPPVVQALKNKQKPFRIAVTDMQLYVGWFNSVFDINGLECIHVAADSRPTPARQLMFRNPEMPVAKMWQYSNVKYILGSKRQLQPLTTQKDFVKVMDYNLNGKPQLLIEYKNTLPRIFAVGNWISETNVTAIIATMINPTTDPAKIAVVMNSDTKSQMLPEFNAIVNPITDYTPERIATTVSLSDTGLVIMVTEPISGWHVSVDGKEQKLIRCNLLQQATIVGPGQHKIVFYYAATDLMSAKVFNIAWIILPFFLIFSLIYVFLSLRKNKINA